MLAVFVGVVALCWCRIAGLGAVTFFSAGDCSGRDFRGCGNSRFRFHFFRGGLGRSAMDVTTYYSTIYMFIGSDVGGGMVRGLRGCNIGVVTLEYTNCGGISLGFTGGHVAVIHIPSCSPCTVTRRALTVVLVLGHGLRHTCVHAHSRGFSLSSLANFSLGNGAMNVVNANGVNRIFTSVYGKLGVGVLNCSPYRDGSFYNGCMALGRLFSRSSVVSLRYPLAGRGGCVVGKRSVLRVGGNTCVVGASHNGLISARTLVSKLGDNRVNTTKLSICRRRASFFFRSFSSRVVHSSALDDLVSVPGIVIASRRTFLAGRTLTNVTRAAIGGLGSFFGANGDRGRVIV